MKRIRPRLLLTAALTTLLLGAADVARADAFAQSILTIDNFRLRNGSGIPYSNTDFVNLVGTNAAHATATLNLAATTATDTAGITELIQPDLSHQMVGLPMPPKPENDFSPFAPPPAVPGTFGYADQRMSGTMIDVPGSSDGMDSQLRADASLASDGTSSGESDVGTSTTFRFYMASADFLTVTFDATPFTQAYATANAGQSTSGIARMAFSVDVRNLTTDETVLSFAPGQLNNLAGRSRTNGFPGLSTHNPGTLSFTSTSLFALNSTDQYEMTINQMTMADAMQTTVPEPGTLAIFGLGLLGMTAIGRRRKSV